MTTLFTRRTGLTLAALAALGLAGTAAHAQSAFKSGDLVISVVGDGSATLSATAAATSLEEITTSGTLVQTISTGLVDSGSATSDGFLTLSTDGHSLTMAGYKGSVGDTGVVASTDPRAVAVIGANGLVTTTAFTDTTYAGNNIRSVASVNGSTLYLSGTATGANGGVRVTTAGSGTSSQVESATLNTRNVNIFGGNVYFSTASGTSGIYSLGAIGSAVPVTPNPVVATGTGSSPYDFFFADANTLFVADDRTTTAGGLLEYTGVNGVFNQTATTFNPAAGVGLRSLTGNGTDIFGVTTANSVVDFNIASGMFSTVFTGATNTAIRGVDFAPTPAAGTPAVPEASTTVSLGLLLALGLGGLVIAKKRTVRAS